MPYWDEPEISAIYLEDETKLKSHIVRIGMTKEEVLYNLGSGPRKMRKAPDNKEVWIYGKFWRGDIQVALTFINGKVEKIEEFYLATSTYQ